MTETLIDRANRLGFTNVEEIDNDNFLVRVNDDEGGTGEFWMDAQRFGQFLGRLS